jgi:hypothetical protein
MSDVPPQEQYPPPVPDPRRSNPPMSEEKTAGPSQARPVPPMPRGGASSSPPSHQVPPVRQRQAAPSRPDVGMQRDYRQRARSARRASSRPPASENGWYLPWWSLVIMVMVVGGAALLMVLTVAGLGEPEAPAEQPPQVQVITSTPMLGQDFMAGAPSGGGDTGAFPTPAPSLAPPTPAPGPSTLPAGEFAINERVQAVAAAGVNIRIEPGLSFDDIYLAKEGEMFWLVDGPLTVDGLEWWKVQHLSNSNLTGWAARFSPDGVVLLELVQ